MRSFSINQIFIRLFRLLDGDDQARSSNSRGMSLCRRLSTAWTLAADCSRSARPRTAATCSSSATARPCRADRASCPPSPILADQLCGLDRRSKIRKSTATPDLGSRQSLRAKAGIAGDQLVRGFACTPLNASIGEIAAHMLLDGNADDDSRCRLCSGRWIAWAPA